MDFFKDLSTYGNELITIIGAGGKTTTLFYLAEECRKLKKRVLVTTSTAIMYPHNEQFDEAIIGEDIILKEIRNIRAPGVYVAGSRVTEEGKLIGINRETIDDIFKMGIFDFILVEGDGSKRLPIKAPAAHEPVIPSLSTKVIGVIGMDALGKEISRDIVHRLEEFCMVTNSSPRDIIDVDKLLLLIKSEKGLFKNTPPEAKKYLLLNKADLEHDNTAIEMIKSKIKLWNLDIEKVFVGPRVLGKC